MWRETSYDEAWRPFTAALDFRPDFSEREHPAVRLPHGALVVDLTPVFDLDPGEGFAAGAAAIDAAALRHFVALAGDDDLVALDWQHPAYRYRPAEHALAGGPWPVPVFPDGDYYAHMTPDLRWGTFGHPWQRTLSIWGADLVDSLGAELATWLPTRGG